jgi:uncharacterized phiE125 gp8 family phage protein
MKLPAMRTKITTPAAVEPVSVDEAKQFLRIDHDDENAFIALAVAAARKQCEDISRRALVTRTYTGYLDGWPWDGCIELPYPPLIAVTSITYFDEADAPAVVNSSIYLVDNTRQPGRIVLRTDADWPSATLRVTNGVQVIWTAGYGAALATPAIYRMLMMPIIGYFYENRDLVLPPGSALLGRIEDALMQDRGDW